MIYGTGQNVAQNVGQGVVEAGFKGHELAQKAEVLQQEKAKLLQQQKELQNTKITKLYDFIKDAKNYKTAGDRNRYLKGAIGMRNVMGIDPSEIPDETIASFGSDENIGRIATLQASVERGEMSVMEASKIAQNPQAFSKVLPTPLDAVIPDKMDFSEGQKEFLNRQNTVRAAEASAGTAGGKEVSKKVAEKYADYVAGGGRTGMKTSLQKLEKAAEALETGKVKTGGTSTLIPGFNSDIAQSALNPKMVAMKTEAQSALNGILRQTLGSAFTAQEGERVLSQIWDDKQPPKENARRLRAKIEELNANVKSAEQEYVKQGFMKEGERMKAKPTSGKFKLKNGKEYSENTLRSMLESNPNSPIAQEIKDALGE